MEVLYINHWLQYCALHANKYGYAEYTVLYNVVVHLTQYSADM